MRAPPVLIGGMVLDVQVRDSAVLMPVHQSLQLQHQLVFVCGNELCTTLQATPHASCDIQPGGTVPGQVKLTSGGVARNIAHCLAILLRYSSSHINKHFPVGVADCQAQGQCIDL